MKRHILPPSMLLAALAALPAWGQETATVIQAENVRYAYAQVLQVTPVYQTLTANVVEDACDQTPAPADDDSRFSRVVGAVKNALGRDGEDGVAGDVAPGCQSIPVQREFRRPIAYDVDYTYRGAKYRSRLPDDPGNRLRIRIGVTPVVNGARSE